MSFTANEQQIIQQLELTSPKELLFYYPYRYEQLTYQPVSHWQSGDQVIFAGPVLKTPVAFRKGKLHIVRFEMLVEQTVIKVIIFNRPWLLKQDFTQPITIIGKYTGHQQVTALNYNRIPVQDQLGITPIYHLKEGITAKRFSNLIKKAFKLYAPLVNELVPADLQMKYQLLKRGTALKYLHFPQDYQQIKLATRTLKYEEFLVFQLQLLLRKQKAANFQQKKPRDFQIDEVFRLVNRLSYQLTPGQLQAVNEILADLKQAYPMHRLLQGDVGSGKTLVAALALAAMTLAQKQSAFLVPTEILAKQQYVYLKKILKPWDFKIACLFASLPTLKRQEILTGLKKGEIDIVVGTHAIFQKQVEYADLGLVIADEQHRFGVQQRAALVNKGIAVDFLLMSATPIPRTLATVLFGELDISTIDTLPSGRLPIKTDLILENSMQRILTPIMQELANDNRCYVICPAISATETVNLRHVTGIYAALKQELQVKRQLPYGIGLLHGKLSSEEKEQVMQDFEQGNTKLLVTTTVVEVGVNVLAANQMVVYNADRFGLSQLHQLRGRIGRSNKQAYCYLLTSATDPDTLKRLEVLTKEHDGFKIAEYDLTLRGPGDVLGIRQSGLPGFILGDFVADNNIVTTARSDAERIIANPAAYQLLLDYIETKIQASAW